MPKSSPSFPKHLKLNRLTPPSLHPQLTPARVQQSPAAVLRDILIFVTTLAVGQLSFVALLNCNRLASCPSPGARALVTWEEIETNADSRFAAENSPTYRWPEHREGVASRGQTQ